MAELNRIKGEFGHAVVDAHSICGEVPRLFDGLLPDFNIGTNDGKSCAASLASAVAKVCDAPGYRGMSSTAASRAGTSHGTTDSRIATSTPFNSNWRSAPT